MGEFTPEGLSVLAGVILSLLFSYVPRLNTKFAAQSKETKQLIMLGLLSLSAGVVFGLSCTQIGRAIGLPLTCDQAGGLKIVSIWVAAIIGNQSMFGVSPQTKTVKAAKAFGK